MKFIKRTLFNGAILYLEENDSKSLELLNKANSESYNANVKKRTSSDTDSFDINSFFSGLGSK